MSPWEQVKRQNSTALKKTVVRKYSSPFWLLSCVWFVNALWVALRSLSSELVEFGRCNSSVHVRSAASVDHPSILIILWSPRKTTQYLAEWQPYSPTMYFIVLLIRLNSEVSLPGVKTKHISVSKKSLRKALEAKRLNH